eukprot:98634-Chlamydomonas_euryale.AAC.5
MGEWVAEYWASTQGMPHFQVIAPARWGLHCVTPREVCARMHSDRATLFLRGMQAHTLLEGHRQAGDDPTTQAHAALTPWIRPGAWARWHLHWDVTAAL